MPSSDYLFVLIDANARTGVGIGEEECKVIGPYGRDTRVSDSNGTSLLRFADDNKLAFVNMFSPSSRDARLVYSTVPGPQIGNVLTTSSRDNHTASLSEMSLFTYSRVRIPTTRSRMPESDSLAGSLVIENREPFTGRKSIDRRVITSDTDRHERLIQLVASQLMQTELSGTVGEQAAFFTDTLLRSAGEVMPGQIRLSCLSGLFEDKARHAEFEKAWTENEEARMAVHGNLVGGSAFRVLRKACRKLSEIMQATENRYLEV